MHARNQAGHEASTAEGYGFFFFIFALLVVALFFKAGRGVLQMDLVTSVSDPAGTALKQDTQTRVPGSLPPPLDGSVS